VAIDVEAEFARGGRTLLDFLTYCVMARRLEPVFAYLVRDYRTRPTPAGALALFDSFLAPQAPARLTRVASHLPPRNIRFQMEVERFRPVSGPTGSPAPTAGADRGGAPPPSSTPVPRYLFDVLVERMREDQDPVLLPGKAFDPALTPAANLPGGRMTEGQRAFVERIWQPDVRPRLVAAGFWRVATVG
jgi:hypothetical protein